LLSKLKFFGKNLRKRAVNKELLDYIKEHLERGASEKLIENILIAHHWKEVDVKKAMKIALAERKLPVWVKIISILCYIKSFFFLISGTVLFGAGLIFFLSTGAAEEELPALSLFLNVFGGGIFLVAGVVLICLALAIFFIARGLWKKQNWARFIVIIVAGAGIIASIFLAVKFKNVAMAAPGLIIGFLIGAYLFFNRKVRSVFSKKIKIKFNKKQLAAALVLPVLLILIIGGSAFSYFYFMEQIRRFTPAVSVKSAIFSSDKNADANIANPENKSLDPREKYLEIRNAWDNAKNFDELKEMLLAYSSKNHSAEIKKLEEQFESVPASFRQGLFIFMKSKIPTAKEITNIGVRISGDKATLEITTTNPKQKGIVVMIMENGEWKLDNENWAD
jgi:hypothetical protein